MIELLTGFAVSLCLTLVVIHYSKLHAHLALDHDVLGPQKFHVHPVPRVGGIGIIVGVASAMLPLAWMKPQLAQLGGLLLLAGLPALGAGLVEDLTKRVSPRVRLGATAVSALLAVWLLNAVIRRTDTLIGVAAGACCAQAGEGCDGAITVAPSRPAPSANAHMMPVVFFNPDPSRGCRRHKLPYGLAPLLQSK